MSTAKIIKLQNALIGFTEIDPEFPIQWAITFLEIAQNEGASLKDIAEETGISMSVMSRTIGALANYRRMGKPYGVIMVKAAKDDKRRKELYLTKKGQKLLSELVSSI